MRSRGVRLLFLAILLVPAHLALSVAADASGDDALARAVRDRLDRDARLRTLDLQVDAHDAVVVLRGSVPTLADVLQSRRIASEVDGVGAVDSQVDLTSRGRADREIAFDLRDRFQNNGDLAGAGLAVTVRGGAVLLTGSVIDARVRDIARRVAASVPGVLGIADEIQAPEDSEASP